MNEYEKIANEELPKSKRIFCVYWTFISLTDLSIGINLDFKNMRVGIHLPFGYINIGYHKVSDSVVLNWKQCAEKEYGWGPFKRYKSRYSSRMLAAERRG